MIGKYLSSVGLALCFLICVLLLGRVVLYRDLPVHTPHTIVQRATSDPEASRQIALDGGALTALALRQLPADCPLKNFSIQLTTQGTILLSGDIALDALALPRPAQLLLPDPCAFSSIISLGYHDGSVLLHPLTLYINGMELPHALIEPLADQVASAITDGLTAQGVHVHALSITDQTLYIQLDP